MREQYVRILVPNYNPDPLSVKQFFQMQSFAKDVQTYLPYQSTTLLDFMSIAYNYCLKTRQNSLDNMACLLYTSLISMKYMLRIKLLMIA